MGLSLFTGSIAGAGNTPGIGSAARLSFPSALAIDAGGNAYVNTRSNDGAGGTSTLWRITPAGVVTPFASSVIPLRFGGEPQSVVVDRTRRLLYSTNAVNAISLDDGTATAVPGTTERLMAGAPDGALFTAVNGIPFIFNVQGPATQVFLRAPLTASTVPLAGGNSFTNGSERDGVGATASFSDINAIAAEPSGSALVASTWTVRRVTRSGEVTTIAGVFNVTGFMDGAGANARFGRITCMAVRDDGLAFVFDAPNRALRTVTPEGVVTTVARDLPAIAGMAFDPGGALRVTFPHAYGTLAANGAIQVLAGQAEPDDAVTGVPPGYGLAVDSRGAVYTTLLASDGTVSIRKYDASGRIVGWGAEGGDLVLARGGASLPVVPNGSLAIDDADNLYEFLSSRSTNQSTAYRITPAGTVQAMFVYASPAIAGAVSPSGTLYFADQWNFSVRVFRDGGFVEIGTVPRSRFVEVIVAGDDGRVLLLASGAGINRVQEGTPFTTIAGDGGKTGHVDATGFAAAFLQPSALALDRQGNVFVRDYDTIRKVTPEGVVTTVAGTFGQLGTRLGPLPGTLGRSTAVASLPNGLPLPAERLALGRDGVLLVQADHALLKVRLQ